MAKRKLSRRQQWRIQKIQEERLARAKNSQAKRAEEFNRLEDTHYHGVVVSHFGATLDIEEKDTGRIFRCALRQNIDSVVCGDKIVWQKLSNIPSDEQILGVVTALDARSSVLARPDFSGQMKPIAANIDQLLIVASPIPELNEGLVDRYLVAAELSNIHPVLILNKIDTLNSEQRTLIEIRIKVYQDLNCPVLFTSARSQHGLDTLYQQLAGKTSVFVGQSGVGKSSLINALLPEANIKEGEVSQNTNKGTHTTSASRLYHLKLAHPGSEQETKGQTNITSLIDSPGVREFGLWAINKEEVIQGFTDLRQFTQNCRFRDCKHLNEPNCGLLDALKNHKISQQRLDSYHRIINSLQ